MGEVLNVIKSEYLKWIRRQVEQFADNIMEEYLEKCEAECNSIKLSCRNTKNFYDSVWGTIEINQGEIFILDSPWSFQLQQGFVSFKSLRFLNSDNLKLIDSNIFIKLSAVVK